MRELKIVFMRAHSKRRGNGVAARERQRLSESGVLDDLDLFGFWDDDASDDSFFDDKDDESGCTDEESAPDTQSEDCNMERKDAYAAGADSLDTS